MLPAERALNSADDQINGTVNQRLNEADIGPLRKRSFRSRVMMTLQ
jgi:hypothetical protein